MPGDLKRPPNGLERPPEMGSVNPLNILYGYTTTYEIDISKNVHFCLEYETISQMWVFSEGMRST